MVSLRGIFLAVLVKSDLWMCGMTPPPAIVALINVSSSSSPRIASWRCLGLILLTFRSLLALPANSSTSAVRYSRIAAQYTAAVAPTRFCALSRCFRNLWILPTGNYLSLARLNSPAVQHGPSEIAVHASARLMGFYLPFLLCLLFQTSMTRLKESQAENPHQEAETNGPRRYGDARKATYRNLGKIELQIISWTPYIDLKRFICVHTVYILSIIYYYV